jgi:hypothetical protein
MTGVFHYAQLVGWNGVLITFCLGRPQIANPPNLQCLSNCTGHVFRGSFLLLGQSSCRWRCPLAHWTVTLLSHGLLLACRDFLTWRLHRGCHLTPIWQNYQKDFTFSLFSAHWWCLKHLSSVLYFVWLTPRLRWSHLPFLTCAVLFPYIHSP